MLSDDELSSNSKLSSEDGLYRDEELSGDGEKLCTHLYYTTTSEEEAACNKDKRFLKTNINNTNKNYNIYDITITEDFILI